MTKGEYLELISKRGDDYGSNGGILDLLSWCRKPNTHSVTLEEARRFFESPDEPYRGEADDKPCSCVAGQTSATR